MSLLLTEFGNRVAEDSKILLYEPINCELIGTNNLFAFTKKDVLIIILKTTQNGNCENLLLFQLIHYIAIDDRSQILFQLFFIEHFSTFFGFWKKSLIYLNWESISRNK